MKKEEISNEKMREALEKIILKAKDMHSLFQAWASAGKYAEDIISIAQSAIDHRWGPVLDHLRSIFETQDKLEESL